MRFWLVTPLSRCKTLFRKITQQDTVQVLASSIFFFFSKPETHLCASAAGGESQSAAVFIGCLKFSIKSVDHETLYSFFCQVGSGEWVNAVSICAGRGSNHSFDSVSVKYRFSCNVLLSFTQGGPGKIFWNAKSFWNLSFISRKLDQSDVNLHSNGFGVKLEDKNERTNSDEETQHVGVTCVTIILSLQQRVSSKSGVRDRVTRVKRRSVST